VQVRARVVNYLSAVIGPLLYMNWMCQPILERFVAGRSAQGFLRRCLRHKSLENRPNSPRLLLLAEFHWDTLDGKSSTGRISKNLLAIPRSRIRCVSNNSDAKSLTLEGMARSYRICPCQCRMVVHFQLPRSRLALPVPGSNSFMNC
jgi:hypothetical protein